MTSNDLDRARRSAPIEELSLERLHERRDRREGRRRVAALITALVIAGGVIFGVATLETDHGVGAAGGAGGSGGSGGAGAFAPGGLRAPPADLTIPDGSYYAGTYAYFYQEQPQGGTREISVSWWRSADGSGRLGDKSYGPGQLPGEGDGVDQLSTDPTVLRDQVIARMQSDGASPEPYAQFTPGPGQPDHITAGLWRSIADTGSGLLVIPQSSPALKAALVQVLSASDGVQTVDNSVDPAGRPGIELTAITEGITHQLWVDPTTYQPMAWRNVNTPNTPSTGPYEVGLVLVAGAADSTDALHISAPLVPVLDKAPTAADLGLS